MSKPMVVNEGSIRRSKAIWFCFGLVFGIGLVSMFIRYAEAQMEQQWAQEPGLIKSCKLPQMDGAMTVFARLDGKPICWVWQ